MLVKNLNISDHIKDKLTSMGWSHVENFIQADECRFAQLFSKEDFIQLSIEITKFKAGSYWSLVRENTEHVAYLKNV